MHSAVMTQLLVTTVFTAGHASLLHTACSQNDTLCYRVFPNNAQSLHLINFKPFVVCIEMFGNVY